MVKVRAKKRMKVARNPAAPASESPQTFPQERRLATIPGVIAVLKRARIPYKRHPLSEDEALNLICDARKDEPSFPIEKLLKKHK